jgi:hypothetical protein
MKDYIRDPKTGALFFNNPQKEEEILRNRNLNAEMESMKEEINSLKRLLNELLVKRN